MEEGGKFFSNSFMEASFSAVQSKILVANFQRNLIRQKLKVNLKFAKFQYKNKGFPGFPTTGGKNGGGRKRGRKHSGQKSHSSIKVIRRGWPVLLHH